MHKLDKICKKLEALNKRLALGYTSTMDFNYGYIHCLFSQKKISRKEKASLILVYGSIDNNDNLFSIKNGKLFLEESQ